MKKFIETVLVLFLISPLGAEPLSPDQRAKVDQRLADLQSWASAPEVLAGLQAPPPSWAGSMTQAKWATLSVLSAEVKELARNPLATWLRDQKAAAVSEVFVNHPDGTKAAFLAKPTNWSHQGKPKHEVPLTGKVWMGEVETDESTGLKQVQVGIPVVRDRVVVGTIVIGLQLSKL